MGHPELRGTPSPGTIENKGVAARFAYNWLKRNKVTWKVLQAKELGTAVEKEQKPSGRPRIGAAPRGFGFTSAEIAERGNWRQEKSWGRENFSNRNSRNGKKEKTRQPRIDTDHTDKT